MRNRIIPAEENDSKQMLEIIESSGAKGRFELLYTRRTNPYISYLHESERVRIGVSKNDDGTIEYQGVSVWDKHFINGEVMNASYITGIKKRQECKKVDLMHLSKYLSFEDTDIFFFSFLNSNEYGKNVFVKHRKYMPELIKVCDYRTFIFNPKQLKSKVENKYNFRKMTKEDINSVTSFLNEQGEKFNFSLQIKDISTQFHVLNIDDCYILEDNEKILAFGALWDRTDDKQYIVKKYSAFMKILKSIPNFTKVLGYIPLPNENEPFKFPIISFLFSQDNNSEYYESFVKEIGKIIERKYSIAVIGMDMRDPNIEYFNKMRKICFDSGIYYLSYNPNLKVNLNMLSHVECALL